MIAIGVHDPKGFGRVRVRRITDASGASLKPFACDSVTSGPRYLPIVKLLELGAFILSPLAVSFIGCNSII